jgi:hypothetical protein
MFSILQPLVGERLLAIHETVWSSMSGVVDGLTPVERHDALSSLRGTWRDPVDKESWTSASKCLRGNDFQERLSCWSK